MIVHLLKHQKAVSSVSKKELMAELDRLKIDYKSSQSKEELQALLESNQREPDEQETEIQENETVADEKQEENLVDKFSKALVTKEEPPDVVDDTVSKLRSKNYGTLTRSQRLVLRANSDEYEDALDGVAIKLNDRIKVEKYVIQLADNTYRTIIKGKIYKLSQSDYESLKDATRKVNTVETEHLCCGRGKKEDVSLIVAVDA